MAVTTRIPQDELSARFDRFTKRFLRDQSRETVSVEVLSADWGDQFESEGTRLIGITYDRKENALEIEVDAGVSDHRVYQPKEVWTVEEPDGFIDALEIVRPDDVREIVRLKRSGDRPADQSAEGPAS